MDWSVTAVYSWSIVIGREWSRMKQHSDLVRSLTVKLSEGKKGGEGRKEKGSERLLLLFFSFVPACSDIDSAFASLIEV
jgi:hypothetical protein